MSLQKFQGHLMNKLETCDVILLSCAYGDTGNALKVQSLLGHCAQHLDKGETHQGPAVLSIAMVAMAKELGLEITIRSVEHLLQYGERNIHRAVPLALGLLCVSNLKVNVMDVLCLLSQDSDSEVAIVRIAQGLVHLGKGLLNLNPYQSDRFLLSPMALAGLVIMLHACLNMKAHYLGEISLCALLPLAMQPRMLITMDENSKPLSVPIWVDQAVDVVDQAG